MSPAAPRDSGAERSDTETFGREAWRPARQTRAQRQWRPGLRRRTRSVRALFTSTVLCLEAVLLFFLGMTLFGLHRGEPVAPWFAGGFAALALVAVLTCALVRRPVGIAIGWALQAVLVVSGVWESSMLVIGPLFALTWWYAVTKGEQLDRENVRREQEQRAWEQAHPQG